MAQVIPERSHPLSRSAKVGVARDNLHQLAEALLCPSVLVLTILGVSYYFDGEITTATLIASLLAFSVTFPGRPRLQENIWRSVTFILLRWFSIASLILFLGYATRSLNLFHEDAIRHWFWIGPLAQVSSHLVFRAVSPWLLKVQGSRRRAVIVGMNGQGVELARRLHNNPYSTADLVGFFDDREESRMLQFGQWPFLGKIAQLGNFCRQEHIELIYLSLPMATQPRIISILDELRDTTASIYFVPDLFVTDLIQGNIDQVANMPVVSVCETPFTGTNGLVKRASDIVLSSLILLMILPVLCGVAIAVKLSSPGPIIFKQRRYGLNGEEITVYKFRSMTVCENGPNVKQAQKNDARITRVGHVLRKTSLDELPQFINVLQGRMSIVGPRPHAVSHNELYRKLIKGYMIRHKVKPGITGWAQVNGLRGETETLDKMQARIEYDLDYLRNWSVALDLKIIIMTAVMMFKDQNAY
jgi:putative colanic acid biosysnthesis UDP-glucose lipid carrier transferase